MQPAKFNVMECTAVVCVLALIGALVVPRFSEATSASPGNPERREQLRMLRCAIERYRQDHDRFPGQMDPAVGGGCSVAAVVAQLTQYSDSDGRTSVTPTDTCRYGPYLRSSALLGTPLASGLAVISQPLASLNSDAERALQDSPAEWVYSCLDGSVAAVEPSAGECD